MPNKCFICSLIFSASGISASFGEMLLLMAIHFHSNQLSAICDLVCSTIGMKIPIRHNTMARMKVIFTQEIFTEQVRNNFYNLFLAIITPSLQFMDSRIP